MAGQVSGKQVNEVIGLVRGMTSNGDEQLSILAYALVIGCRSCSVDRDAALEKVSELFDEPIDIVPLHEMRN